MSKWNWANLTPDEKAKVISCADKAEMWRAPKEILGKYAALDAEATWLLWDKVLRPAWDYFEVYQEYHKTWLAGPHGLQYHHVWQKLRGLSINTEKLATLRTNLERRLGELETAFREHAEVKAHISKFEHDVLAQLMQERPNMWKKLPELGAEPDKYTKKGPVSQSWVKWEEKRVSLEQLKKDIKLYEALEAWTPLTEAQVSHHWKGWRQRFTEAAGSKHFNMRSAEHKRKLFYDAMGYPVLVFTDSETNPQPAVDDEALKGFGEAGKLLQTYASVEKLRSTVVSLTEKLDANGTYHPELRIPGTHTGRLSGAGGFNAQNVAKVKELLETFQARPGCSLVFADIAALEPATLAQCSQDATYLKLYGPAAKPDDVYSHVAAQLGGELGQKIRATGYDPDNPNKEAIAKIKKEAKKERNIAKLLHLSCIAEGTLVRVRGQGWKPIETICKEDVVWDGFDWTTQAGSVYRGTKGCINFRDTALTLDHEVLTHDGWQISERADPTQCIQTRLPSGTWADVWKMAVHCTKALARRFLPLD